MPFIGPEERKRAREAQRLYEVWLAKKQRGQDGGPVPGPAPPFGGGTASGSMANARGRSYRQMGKRAYAKKRTVFKRHKARISDLCETAVFRLQGVKQEIPNEDPDDTTYRYPGYYTIGKGTSAGLGGMVCPVYTIDLTRIANVGSVGVGSASFCVSQLNLDDSGNPTWVQQGCQDFTGTTLGASFYQLEKTNSDSTSSWAAQYVQTMWYDIRFKLYGARKQCVTYDVMLCQAREDWAVPNYNAAGYDAADTLSRKALYQQLAKSAMVNTIMPGTSGWMKFLKVKKRARFVIQPSLSTELERNPNSVDFRWFIKDGRFRSHHQNQSIAASDVAVDAPTWNVETVSTETTNDPVFQRSRMFLIVRATDMTPFTPVTDDQDDTPSFDMVVRKRLRFFPPNG